MTNEVFWSNRSSNTGINLPSQTGDEAYNYTTLLCAIPGAGGLVALDLSSMELTSAPEYLTAGGLMPVNGAVSPDGSIVALQTGDYPSAVHLYNRETQTYIGAPHTTDSYGDTEAKSIRGQCFADDNSLFINNAESAIQVWDSLSLVTSYNGGTPNQMVPLEGNTRVLSRQDIYSYYGILDFDYMDFTHTFESGTPTGGLAVRGGGLIYAPLSSGLRVWDETTLEDVTPEGVAHHSAFPSPDMEYVACVAPYPYGIKVYEPDLSTLIIELASSSLVSGAIRAPIEANGLIISPDSRFIAVAGINADGFSLNVYDRFSVWGREYVAPAGYFEAVSIIGFI